MKNLKYTIQAIIIFIFFIFSKIIGIKLSRFFFKHLFYFLGPIIRSNNIIKKNIKLISSSKEKNLDLKSVVKNMWFNYGMTFAEYMHLNEIRNNFDHYVKIKNVEVLEKIKNKNKPVIFVSGHFANFEIMSLSLTKMNIKLATIYRPLNNFFINPLMIHLRKKYICKNQIKKGRGGVRDALQFLDNLNCIALMIDQRVSEGDKLKLFGTEAYTTTLPANLALKYKCDIVPIYLERNKTNNFEMKILDPIIVSDMINNSENKQKISLNLNLILEEMILKKPDQWILTHNRWK